ncbi:hypothetical protein [Mycoplasma suis]|uniref:Uncharacterized protein n=1 Tax=Mycoplasma suis (strain Illinois) TaxID=768700 RepID=F0QRI2_MYCSL|nr:hypothetical protein [Mycoplasma suis]ADX98102.1 hypothetical protein MSU_0569 [Mycoplasma suis str. Illinois]
MIKQLLLGTLGGISTAVAGTSAWFAVNESSSKATKTEKIDWKKRDTDTIGEKISKSKDNSGKNTCYRWNKKEEGKSSDYSNSQELSEEECQSLVKEASSTWNSGEQPSIWFWTKKNKFEEVAKNVFGSAFKDSSQKEKIGDSWQVDEKTCTNKNFENEQESLLVTCVESTKNNK